MNRRIAVPVLATVAIGVVLAGAYEAYVLGPPASPCAGVVTPTGPLRNVSTISAGALSWTPEPLPPVAAPARSANSPSVINVVAGENVWGSLVSQIGGAYVHVTSILTDPNKDPHDYQSNSSTAIAFAQARYVILNNVGYDDWGNTLLAADGVANQTVLNIGDSLGVFPSGGIVSGNPHLWYNPTFVNRTVAWMTENLSSIEPSLAGYFAAQASNLTKALASLSSQIGTMWALFGGTVVASTESIFVYLANATGLDLVSPPAFMEAVSEGNDPSDASQVTFQCQLESGHVRVLIVNAQTVTPLTDHLRTIATEHNVSVVSMTESLVPPDDTFQTWMGGQLSALYVALDAPYLGT